MRILVIGAGMMGWAAAFDMARSERVQAVTLADKDDVRLTEAVERVNRLVGKKKVIGATLDAADSDAALKLMQAHEGVLSAVPYFYNLKLAKVAIRAG